MSNQTKCGIRIVNRDGHKWGTDVFDLETGRKIINVRRIEMDLSRDIFDVKVTTTGPVEYEGPATIIEGEPTS